jgi:glutathione S-transferase
VSIKAHGSLLESLSTSSYPASSSLHWHLSQIKDRLFHFITMVFEVYLDPCTVNSRKVLAGLDLLGTEYHLNHINYFTGEHKSPEYAKLNPCQTVPTAHDDTADYKDPITESNVILMYAADRDGGNPAYPKELHLRANVNRWLLWEASVWFHSCYVYLVEYVVKPLLNDQPDEAIIREQDPTWKKLASILETQLGKTKWLVGDGPTIADISVMAPIHLHGAQQLPLSSFPNLLRWIEQMESLPCWQKTQGAVEKALLPNKTANANGTVSKDGSLVRATLNYTKELDQKLTELYFYETNAAKNIHEPGDDPHEVELWDGWSRAHGFTLDKHGFEIKGFQTSFNDWTNEDAVKTSFYPEVVEFLKKDLGAKRVLVFDHTIRTKENDEKKLTQETNTSQRAPVMLVHCDYTDESGPKRVQQLLPNEAEALLHRRLAFINVWKPIHNMVEERPLAMCDVTSSPPNDFFKLYLRYRDRVGENYVMRYNKEHKWWYFPKMKTDQVIMLKTFDSAKDGRARFVGHSAFEDPTTRNDAPTRESVEIRTIAFF